LLDIAHDTVNATVRPEDYKHPDALMSARNFAAYLGIRQEDVRVLQRDLHRCGLSSLGRMDTHTLSSLDAVRRVLATVTGQTVVEQPVESLDYDLGEVILARRTAELLGPRPPHRSARIMVTMPAEAASHFELVRDLVGAGMEVMRINCAHDDPPVWLAMIENAHRASRELQRPCAVLCDLPGPKLRTGPIERGEGVVRWHAFKNDYGEVIEPARIWLSAGAPEPMFAHAILPVNREFVEQLRGGDEIHFRDHQGRNRWLVVTQVVAGGAWCEGARGAFMLRGIPLEARRFGEALPIKGFIGELPPIPREIPLKTGDLLTLTAADILGRPPSLDRRGSLREPGQIGCSLPQVFRDVRPGERVFFDDGKIAGVVEDVQAQKLTVRITWTRAVTTWLAEDKGINLPDTLLALPALAEPDLAALDFIREHSSLINIVGLSFVRGADDVAALYDQLDRLAMPDHGVLLKIETRAGFQNLPGIILSALQRNRVGVMIARGDLGVEVGFERMAEL
jgi:pyruvate kinase